jgi:hypothetical protein
MRKYLSTSFNVLCVIVFMLACDKPDCKNTNPVFEQNRPETKAYKDELVKQLRQVDKSRLSFWFDGYQADGGARYLNVLIRGDGLCAKGILIVKEWDDKLEGIQKSKGVGYMGAELKNLQIDVYQDSAKTELIYQGVDTIVD